MNEFVLVKKAEASVIGLLVGDALGASVEGFSPEEISQVAQENGCGAFLNRYIPAIQMGSVTPLRTEIGYRWASEVDDEQFVSPGPTTRDALQPFLRCGHYSDDGNTSLALAESLLRCRSLNGADCARSYAGAWKQGGGPTTRGYPPTAKKVMQAVHDGTDYKLTGLPPHFQFPGGSFANGGAMRISPLAIAFRNCEDKSLFRTAVSEAIRSSHVHPEAIDGAVVQAETVRKCLLHGLAPETGEVRHTEPAVGSEAEVSAASSVSPCRGHAEDFDWERHVAHLAELCETEAMSSRLSNLLQEFRALGPAPSALPKAGEDTTGTGPNNDPDFEADMGALKRLVPNTRPGSGLGFQIAAIDAIPCVLWFLCRYANSRPAECLPRAVGCGGDTDTVASMCGAALGALYGGRPRPSAAGAATTRAAPVSLPAGPPQEAPPAEPPVGVPPPPSTPAAPAAETIEEKSGGLGVGKDAWWWLGPDLVSALENDHPRGRDHALRVAAALATDLDLRFVQIE